MRKIYILGSGGFAKEVFSLIKDIGGYEICGFVDFEPRDSIAIGNQVVQVFPESILESIDNVALGMGIGSPEIIEKLASKFRDRFDFPNLIHPSVIGNFDDIELGVGNIFTANCILTTTIKIGSFNIFNLACTIGHDSVVGSYNVMNPAVNISGGVIIGNANLIGVNATILQYKTIGNNCVVGASSLVTKDVNNNSKVIGIPAIRI